MNDSSPGPSPKGTATFFNRLKADFEADSFDWVGNFSDFALGYLTFASTILARVKIVMPGLWAQLSLVTRRRGKPSSQIP